MYTINEIAMGSLFHFLCFWLLGVIVFFFLRKKLLPFYILFELRLIPTLLMVFFFWLSAGEASSVYVSPDIYCLFLPTSLAIIFEAERLHSFLSARRRFLVRVVHDSGLHSKNPNVSGSRLAPQGTRGGPRGRVDGVGRNPFEVGQIWTVIVLSSLGGEHFVPVPEAQSMGIYLLQFGLHSASRLEGIDRLLFCGSHRSGHGRSRERPRNWVQLRLTNGDRPRHLLAHAVCARLSSIQFVPQASH